MGSLVSVLKLENVVYDKKGPIAYVTLNRPKVMNALKNTKSPEEYYEYFFTLPQFTNPKLLERTLQFAVSPEVRSQDALQLVTSVLANPAGERVAWDFIRQHWPELEKAGAAGAPTAAATE